DGLRPEVTASGEFGRLAASALIEGAPMKRPAPPTPDDLLALLAKAGYRRVLPNVLYPASVFLDLSGEDLRRRMYLTTDAEGNELCLRPDLTIPTALLHLAGPDAAAEAAYCYLGPVYRFRHNAPG